MTTPIMDAETTTPLTDKPTPAITAVLRQQIDHACNEACRMIAPAWPLDRSIAVNPHWSRVGMPVREVAARLLVLGDIQVFPARAAQQLAWEQGRITAPDLQQALAAAAGGAGRGPDAGPLPARVAAGAGRCAPAAADRPAGHERRVRPGCRRGGRLSRTRSSQTCAACSTTTRRTGNRAAGRACTTSGATP